MVIRSSLLVLVSLTAIAAAQPAVTASLPAESEPAAYVQVGALAGVVGDDVSVEAAVAGGVRLAHTPLWVHAGFLEGESAVFFVDRVTKRDQARLGLEGRGCRVRGIVCVSAGVDGAVLHTRSTGTGAGTWDIRPSDPVMTSSATTALVIPRLGVDFGGRHLRYGPAVEVALDRHGYASFEVVQAVGWHF